LGAFDALMSRYPEAVSPEAAGALRQVLVAERDRLVFAMHGENHALEVAQSLSLSLARVDGWPLEGEGWSMLAVGFRKSYARGRRALRLAEKHPTTERCHDWRKHAKYHWYHVRLLERVWPQAMKALKSSLEHLTEELGGEHDLDDLRLVLLEHTPPEALRDATARVLTLIQARRQELRAAAFARGQHVYAEHPDAAASRFASYHAAWLSEPETDDEDAGADD
jgi:CHAD domain-containing protein